MIFHVTKSRLRLGSQGVVWSELRPTACCSASLLLWFGQSHENDTSFRSLWMSSICVLLAWGTPSSVAIRWHMCCWSIARWLEATLRTIFACLQHLGGSLYTWYNVLSRPTTQVPHKTSAALTNADMSKIGTIRRGLPLQSAAFFRSAWGVREPYRPNTCTTYIIF